MRPGAVLLAGAQTITGTKTFGAGALASGATFNAIRSRLNIVGVTVMFWLCATTRTAWICGAVSPA